MRGVCCSLMLVLFAAGCGQGQTPEATSDMPGKTADEERVTMTGDMELVLFDDTGPGDGPEKPTFKVTSSKCTHLGGKTWAFEEARATIYNRDAEETVLTAGRGRIDQETKRAVLEEGVTLQEGTLTIELSDLEWSNEDRVAESGHPATIIDGETRLEAAALRFYPDQRKLIMKEVHGVMALQRKDVP